MKSPVIVFDFDKTLTEKDTLFGFYKAVSGGSYLFKLKFLLLLFFAVLTKLKLISNSSLKKWGIRLFLRKIDKETLLKKGKEYAGIIELNAIYENEFKQYPSENVVIMSASFEEYLKPLFPDYKVFGSKILFDNKDRVTGLGRNLYGVKKVYCLHSKGVGKIDVLYTDSYSDKPLMEISKSVYLVENSSKKLIKGDSD